MNRIDLDNCIILPRYQSVLIEFNPKDGPLISAEVLFDAGEDRYGDRINSNFRIGTLYAYDDNGDDVEVSQEEIETFIQIAKDNAE